MTADLTAVSFSTEDRESFMTSTGVLTLTFRVPGDLCVTDGLQRLITGITELIDNEPVDLDRPPLKTWQGR